MVCLNGEECKLSLSSSTLGREVHQIVSQQLPSRKGRKSTMQHGNSKLILGQTLQGQGVVGEAVTLSCTNRIIQICILHGDIQFHGMLSRELLGPQRRVSRKKLRDIDKLKEKVMGST